MLAAIERSLPGIGFDPNHPVDQFPGREAEGRGAPGGAGRLLRGGEDGGERSSELFEGYLSKRGMSLGFCWTYTTSGGAVNTMIHSMLPRVRRREGCHVSDCLFPTPHPGGLLNT